MREERTGPWLFSLNCFDPHSPFDPPQEWLDHYPESDMPGPLFRESDLAAQERLKEVNFQRTARRPEEMNARSYQARYYAMVELIDHNVGRMLDALEESGQLDDTVVIFTSDHGETLGDHGLLLKGCRFYESLVHVSAGDLVAGTLQAGAPQPRLGRAHGPRPHPAGTGWSCRTGIDAGQGTDLHPAGPVLAGQA